MFAAWHLLKVAFSKSHSWSVKRFSDEPHEVSPSSWANKTDAGVLTEQYTVSAPLAEKQAPTGGGLDFYTSIYLRRANQQHSKFRLNQSCYLRFEIALRHFQEVVNYKCLRKKEKKPTHWSVVFSSECFQLMIQQYMRDCGDYTSLQLSNNIFFFLSFSHHASSCYFEWINIGFKLEILGTTLHLNKTPQSKHNGVGVSPLWVNVISWATVSHLGPTWHLGFLLSRTSQLWFLSPACGKPMCCSCLCAIALSIPDSRRASVTSLLYMSPSAEKTLKAQ